MDIYFSVTDPTTLGTAVLEGEISALEGLIKSATERATAIQVNLHRLTQDGYKAAYDERKQIIDTLPAMHDRLRRCRAELKKRVAETEAELAKPK